MIDVSVVVLVYNSEYSKLKATLKSIVSQKEVKYEIIIADDGSIDNCSKMIKDFFEKYKNISYYYIRSEENRGTVCNFYQGVKKASGIIIKPISPGDLFYDSLSLKKIVNFMKEHDAKVAFGKAIHYSVKENSEIEIMLKSSPKLFRDYNNDNYNFGQICTDLLIYKDNILGAGLIYEKRILIDYLEIALSHVIYVEDLVTYIMAADGIQIFRIDDNIIWYEDGFGVSTSKNPKWEKRIWQDEWNCYYLIKERLESKIIINKAILLHNIIKIKNVIVKKCLRIIVEPSLIIFNLKKRMMKRDNSENIELKYLNYYLDIKGKNK